MSADFAAARTIMVDSQVRTQDVTDLAIQDAMRAVPREALLPASKSFLAYADAEVEYAPGRWLLRPRYVAKLLQGLAPRSGDKALAIAAPYAASVLEAMGLTVTRMEGDDLLAAPGDQDLVVCEGAVTEVPRSWLDALAVGGRLGVVHRDGPLGRAMLYLRTDNGVGGRPLFDCAAPILPGFEARSVFTL